MQLKKFLEKYRIIERFAVVQEHELKFDDLNEEDNNLIKIIIDKSSYKFIQEYSTGTGALYDIYLNDTYRKVIKSDLTIEELEEFIESL